MGYIIQSFSLGAGLAMDACAVSMTNGLSAPNMKKSKMFLIALAFSLFQAVMPLIGYFAGQLFIDFIGKFIPYIALLILGFIGINMLLDSLKKEDDGEKDNSLTFKKIIVQAVATSIDALSVGITIIAYAWYEALISALIIGAVTFVLCFISIIIGKKFGDSLGNKAKILGGIILVAIGIEIFVSGVFF